MFLPSSAKGKGRGRGRGNKGKNAATPTRTTPATVKRRGPVVDAGGGSRSRDASKEEEDETENTPRSRIVALMRGEPHANTYFPLMTRAYGGIFENKTGARSTTLQELNAIIKKLIKANNNIHKLTDKNSRYTDFYIKSPQTKLGKWLFGSKWDTKITEKKNQLVIVILVFYARKIGQLVSNGEKTPMLEVFSELYSPGNRTPAETVHDWNTAYLTAFSMDDSDEFPEIVETRDDTHLDGDYTWEDFQQMREINPQNVFVVSSDRRIEGGRRAGSEETRPETAEKDEDEDGYRGTPDLRGGGGADVDEGDGAGVGTYGEDGGGRESPDVGGDEGARADGDSNIVLATPRETPTSAPSRLGSVVNMVRRLVEDAPDSATIKIRQILTGTVCAAARRHRGFTPPTHPRDTSVIEYLNTYAEDISSSSKQGTLGNMIMSDLARYCFFRYNASEKNPHGHTSAITPNLPEMTASVFLSLWWSKQLPAFTQDDSTLQPQPSDLLWNILAIVQAFYETPDAGPILRRKLIKLRSESPFPMTRDAMELVNKLFFGENIPEPSEKHTAKEVNAYVNHAEWELSKALKKMRTDGQQTERQNAANTARLAAEQAAREQAEVANKDREARAAESRAAEAEAARLAAQGAVSGNETEDEENAARLETETEQAQ